jgi:starch synthase
LVPFESDGTPLGAPKDREAFARAFAGRVNELVADPARAAAFGAAGRARVEATFSWSAIAKQTAALYQSLRRPRV